jgi:hypothetical protein
MFCIGTLPTWRDAMSHVAHAVLQLQAAQIVPQPVTRENPNVKTSRPGWLGGWT